MNATLYTLLDLKLAHGLTAEATLVAGVILDQPGATKAQIQRRTGINYGPIRNTVLPRLFHAGLVSGDDQSGYRPAGALAELVGDRASDSSDTGSSTTMLRFDGRSASSSVSGSLSAPVPVDGDGLDAERSPAGMGQRHVVEGEGGDVELAERGCHEADPGGLGSAGIPTAPLAYPEICEAAQIALRMKLEGVPIDPGEPLHGVAPPAGYSWADLVDPHRVGDYTRERLRTILDLGVVHWRACRIVAWFRRHEANFWEDRRLTEADLRRWAGEAEDLLRGLPGGLYAELGDVRAREEDPDDEARLASQRAVAARVAELVEQARADGEWRAMGAILVDRFHRTPARERGYDLEAWLKKEITKDVPPAERDEAFRRRRKLL
jgi:hypothetical protein